MRKVTAIRRIVASERGRLDPAVRVAGVREDASQEAQIGAPAQAPAQGAIGLSLWIFQICHGEDSDSSQGICGAEDCEGDDVGEDRDAFLEDVSQRGGMMAVQKRRR